MPTIEEIKREVELQGGGQEEVNRRIAEAQTAGTLTLSEPQKEKASEAMSGRMGLYRKSLDVPDILMPSAVSVPQKLSEVRSRIESPFAGATELEAQQVPVTPEEAQTVSQRMLPEGIGGFEQQQPIPTSIQLPKVAMPSIRGLQEAIEAVPKAYKKAETALTEAAREKMGAVGEWEKVGIEEARAKRSVLEARQKEYEAFEAGRIEREQERQDYMNTEMAKMQDAVDSIRAMKIDPTRFYRHPDGTANYPKTVAAAVAIGLGALGSTLPAQYGGGGPNVALQIVDKAIDRDIQAQRDDIANQRAGVGLQMNLLSQMRGQVEGERKAELMTKAIMLDGFDMQLEKAAAMSVDKRVVAEAAMLRAEIKESLTKIVEDYNIESEKEHRAGEQILFGARTKRAAMQQAQQAQQAKAMKAAAGPAAFPGARILDPNYVPNKEDEKAAKPMVAAWRESSKQLNDLLAWRAEYGQEKLDRGALAIANTKLQRLKSAMRKVDETGAKLDAGEIEMMGLDFSMGDYGWIKERLTAVRDSVRDKVAARIHVHGYALEDQPVAGFVRK